MTIERRKRGANLGSTVSHTDQKIKYNLDVNVLSLFCSFVLSENKNIKRGQLVNLRNLMAVMDMDVYQADPERKKLIEFINRGLEARIKKDLKDKRLILSYIKGGIVDIDFDELEKFSELSDSELAFVVDTIHGALDSMIIENNIDATYEALTRYKAEDYRYRSDIVGDIKAHVSAIHNSFRQVSNMSSNDTIFSFDKDILEELGIGEVYDNDLPKVLTLALVNALVANIYVSSHPDVPLWHCMGAALLGGSVSIGVRLFISFGQYGRFIQTQFVAQLFELQSI